MILKDLHANVAQCLTLLKPPNSDVKHVGLPGIFLILCCVFRADLLIWNASSQRLGLCLSCLWLYPHVLCPGAWDRAWHTVGPQ